MSDNGYQDIPEAGYRQLVTFYKHATKGKNMVQVEVPGLKESTRRQVRPEDAKRWPAQWAAFMDEQEMPAIEGTPLTEIPGMTPERIVELSVLRLTTVEQIAELSDAGLQNLGMGALVFRRAAQQVMAMKGNSGAAEENLALKAQIAQLEADKAKAQEETNARFEKLEQAMAGKSDGKPAASSGKSDKPAAGAKAEKEKADG
mgnify:CR=1 FL=1